MSERATGRRGGRKGAAVRRSNPAVSPVSGGLNSGAYTPLKPVQIEQIFEAALDVLETVGMAGAIPSCRTLFTTAGAQVTEQGRLCIPRDLVRKMMALTPKSLTLHGRGERDSIEISDQKVHMCTGGSAVHMLDHKTGIYRDTSLADLYNVTRLSDAMTHIHCYQRTVIARDMKTDRDLDINTAYAILSGTTKPCGISLTDPDSVPLVVEMLDMVAGGPGEFRKKPFCWLGATFIVPPLSAAEEAQYSLEHTVRAGVPYLYASVPQTGTTGPAPLAGTLVQSLAEALFVLCYIQLLSPGHPFLFGCWPFVSDLRTGAFSGGGGEQAVLMAAAAQIAGHLGLPSNIAAGMTDSKEIDVQSGFEKGYSIALAALAGANVLWAYPGMLGSLMTFSQEQLVIDNDILGNVMRMVRGIETDSVDLSVKVIAEASIDPGHYIAHPQTLERMERDFLYPEISDRKSTNEWLAAKRPDIRDVAHTRVCDILKTHFPMAIAPEVDRKIRDRFDIQLPPELMRKDENHS